MILLRIRKDTIMTAVEITRVGRGELNIGAIRKPTADAPAAMRA